MMCLHVSVLFFLFAAKGLSNCFPSVVRDFPNVLPHTVHGLQDCAVYHYESNATRPSPGIALPQPESPVLPVSANSTNSSVNATSGPTTSAGGTNLVAVYAVASITLIAVCIVSVAYAVRVRRRPAKHPETNRSGRGVTYTQLLLSYFEKQRTCVARMRALKSLSLHQNVSFIETSPGPLVRFNKCQKSGKKLCNITVVLFANLLN